MPRSARRAVIPAAAFLLLLMLWWVNREVTPADASSPGPAETHAVAPTASRRPARTRPRPSPRLAPTAAPGLDPMLALLDGQQAATVAVVELNAVLNAPVGELLVACAGLEEGGPRVAMLAELLGPDPLQKLDRLALVDRQLVFSGHFAQAVPRLKALGAQAVGAHGLAHTLPGVGLVTLWRDELALVTPTLDAAKALVARLESGRPAAEPLLSSAELTGDVVLSIGAKDLVGTTSGLDRIKLVVDARDDVFAQLRVDGATPAVLTTARSAFEARLAATKAGPAAKDPLVAALLESVTVADHGGGFELTADVPLDFVRARLAACETFLPHAVPEGYTTTSSMSLEGWSLAPPPGMVLVSTHKDRLRAGASNKADMDMMLEIMALSPETYIDPRTLQIFSAGRHAAPGMCARATKMAQMMRTQKNVRVDEVTIGGRVWLRTTDNFAQTRSVTYGLCLDDVEWSANVGVTTSAPLEVVQARVEAYLATATLIGAPPPP